MTRTKKSLPILTSLDDVRVASPCSADWDGMTAANQADGARARFCGSCEKNVYDLSSMTRVEAMALIERHEGSCCVRFYQRADGTVLTADCPVGVRAALKRAEGRALAGMAAGIGAAATFVAFLVGGVSPVGKKLSAVKERVETRLEQLIATEPLDAPMMGAMPSEQPSPGEIAPPTPPPARKTMGKIAAPSLIMGDIGG